MQLILSFCNIRLAISNEKGNDQLFVGEAPSITVVVDIPHQKSKPPPWKLMIIDDDEVARRLLKEYMDTAVLLLVDGYYWPDPFI